MQEGLAARAEARVGLLLRGKWRLDRLLGVGGCAAVYAATHRAGKRVAVKVLHPELAISPDICRRFLREAYAANAVEHPGVVSVLDDETTEEGLAFLVMDLLEGETLDARRKAAGGKLDPSDVLALADQILEVLAAAHAKNIIHRDLKPENLFLTQGGQVRILDFGIARFRESATDTAMTEVGMTMGSPAFMPPEQARGRWDLVDARTDIWAVGATLFTLLSGKLVHGGGTRNEALIASATKPAPSISTLLPALPPAIAALVDRALAFDKEARWPSALAMQDAVRVAHHTLSGDAAMTVPLMAAPALPEAPPTGVTTSGAWSSSAGAPAAQPSDPSLPAVPAAGHHGPGHTEVVPLEGIAAVTKPPVITTIPSELSAHRGGAANRRAWLVGAVGIAAATAAVLGVAAVLRFSGGATVRETVGGPGPETTEDASVSASASASASSHPPPPPIIEPTSTTLPPPDPATTTTPPPSTTPPRPGPTSPSKGPPKPAPSPKDPGGIDLTPPERKTSRPK